MMRNNAGPWLLAMAVTLALCVWCVAGKHQRLETRSMIKELNNLRTYMEELDYIEKEEQHQGHTAKDTTTVEEDAMIETCSVMVKSKLQTSSDDEYHDVIISNLELWDKCYRLWTNKVTIANWNFETDITEEHEQVLSKASLDFSVWVKDLAGNAQLYIDHPKYSTLDKDLQRKLRFMAFNVDPTDKDDMKELVHTQTKLQQIYSEATVDVSDDGPDGKTSVSKLKLEPNLTQIMAEVRRSDTLLAAWWSWRNVTGPLMRDQYATMVHLLNKGAKEHGFLDYAEAWMESQFDNTNNLEEMAENLWSEMLPLYQELHAYVRTKLQKKYPEYDDIFKNGGIPAHLLGNMWAQNWENIYDLVKPYPNIEEPDYDEEMKSQGYTVDKMFQTAEEFYTSIGLYPMSSEFKQLSMKVRPEGREVVCHASASDFFSEKPNKDFRIKMCTDINMDSFETIHHEMGHIEYFMAYQEQPAIYRTGANSAFHEAIGDTISLSFRSSKHLQTIGLSGGSDVSDKKNPKHSLRDFESIFRQLRNDYQRNINFLLKRALFKIGFLPFGYMIDKWRWNVFRGITKQDNYNKNWWELRLQYQGLVAPIERSEADFDPGAKFHIPSNSPYICYFISFVVQFQFYKAMCDQSGHTGPLYECDFYQSEEAGRKLRDMMELGKSLPWPEAMEKLTGSREFSTEAIREYFHPLFVWLKEENRRLNVPIGWRKAKINWKYET